MVVYLCLSGANCYLHLKDQYESICERHHTHTLIHMNIDRSAHHPEHILFTSTSHPSIRKKQAVSISGSSFSRNVHDFASLGRFVNLHYFCNESLFAFPLLIQLHCIHTYLNVML